MMRADIDVKPPFLSLEQPEQEQILAFLGVCTPAMGIEQLAQPASKPADRSRCSVTHPTENAAITHAQILLDSRESLPPATPGSANPIKLNCSRSAKKTRIAMIKRALKRLIPPSMRPPLRRAFDASRNLILRPGTLRQAAAIHSRLTHYAEGRPTVIFFAPEAGVTVYLRTQAVLARILRAQGCNVVFVRCFELLPRCPVKDMELLPFDAPPGREQEICLECYRGSVRQLNEFGLDFVDLREIIDATVRNRIDAAMALLSGDRLDFDYDGINVGALAFYDFAISHKHPVSQPMSPAGRAAWLKYVRNAIIAIEMTRGLLERFRPVTLACFDEYSMMSAARLFAKRRGVAVRMVSIAYHLNGDLRRPMAMSSLTIMKEQAWRLEQWGKWRDVPLTPELVAAAVDDIVHRLTKSGAHIYSPNKTLDTDGLRAGLRLDPARRVLVAYTSSRDEHDALMVNLHGLGIEPAPANDAFEDTFEWLHALIARVEASADLQLIVRVHPRVGVTSRDNRVSTEYARYRAEFSGSYRHCRFVWPEEAISSFDLAEFADLALVSWSSIGMELARLGVPVLSGNRSMITIGPDEGFIQHASTREQYFLSLERMTAGIDQPGEQLRLCMRWYHLFNLSNAIDLRDVIGPEGQIGDMEKAKHAALVREILIDGAEALHANLAALAAQAAAPESRRAETEALRGQVGRLVEFICTGGDPAEPPVLRPCDNSEMQFSGQRGRISLVGDDLIYDDGSLLWRRRSRLVARLKGIFETLAPGVPQQAPAQTGARNPI